MIEKRIIKTATYKVKESLRPPEYKKKITGSRIPAARYCCDLEERLKIRPDPSGG